MTLRTALRTSSNRAAVRLLEDVGIAKTVSYAKAMGVGSVPNVPSLALGSGEVTLMSMTAAYAAFANKGMLPQPTLIRRVEDLEGAGALRRRGGAEARRQRDHGLPAHQHARRRGEPGHRLQGTAAGVHAAGGRQDRHDQRLRGRLVRRLHPEPRHGRVGRLRSAADDPRERVRRRPRRAAVGAVHARRHQGRQARVVHARPRTSSG